MGVTELIEAAHKLSADERQAVVRALLSPPDDTIRKRQARLNQRLVVDGLLKRIPDLERRDTDFTPITITGKPLSETIIEERR